MARDHTLTDTEPLSPGGRRGRRARFVSAYSRWVTLLRIALPLAALGLLALIIAWPGIQPSVERFRVGATDAIGALFEEPRMANARYLGRDAKRRPFVVTAASAVQQPETSETLVMLERPAADITLEDGAWLAILADSGVYRENTEQLDLAGNVTLFHDQGYEMKTEAARIDLAAGTASGDAPVVAHGPAGVLHAQGFRMDDFGGGIHFTGAATLTLLQAAP
ncbi:MAG: LPS export ABC transporter periplasmic protein LptC [Alphaproteobacteria bacterium]